MKSTGQLGNIYIVLKTTFLSYSEYYYQPLTLISAALLVHISVVKNIDILINIDTEISERYQY